MSCSKCVDASKDLYHDRCRSHSYCSRDFLYFAAPCSVCQDLWARAQDLDAVDGAVRAFQALEEWVIGFRKNSRHRPPGTDYFFDPEERAAYNDLHALHANLPYVGLVDDPPPDPSVPRVSLLLCTNLPFWYCELFCLCFLFLVSLEVINGVSSYRPHVRYQPLCPRKALP